MLLLHIVDRVFFSAVYQIPVTQKKNIPIATNYKEQDSTVRIGQFKVNLPKTGGIVSKAMVELWAKH